MAIPLKITELKEGGIYQCLLSGNRVLVDEVNISERYIYGSTFKYEEVVAYVSNLGKVLKYDIHNYQLAELDNADFSYLEKAETDAT
jgi:hypothetical protein